MAAERGQGLGLELADAFRRHPKLRAHLFERPGVVGLKAEPQPYDGLLSGWQALQRLGQEGEGLGVHVYGFRPGRLSGQVVLERPARVGVDDRVEGDNLCLG